MHPSNILTSIVPIMVVIPAIIAAPTVEIIKRGPSALEPRKYLFNYWWFYIQIFYTVSLSPANYS